MVNHLMASQYFRLPDRRGFVLFSCLATMMIIFISAIATQSVALQDLNLASRNLGKTQAYLNARSGIEIALSRLKEQSKSDRFDSRTTAKLPSGGFQVEVTAEVAEAFGKTFNPLSPKTQVYLIDSRSQVPAQRQSRYESNLFAVIQLVEGSPKVLLWSERTGTAPN